jgi:hypothetical protein
MISTLPGVTPQFRRGRLGEPANEMARSPKELKGEIPPSRLVD